jgi:hypothetical protein
MWPNHHARAVRFFWTVLIAASAASIAGNAEHALLHATTAPAAVAATVATAPPLVLLASTEGVSLLQRARQHGSLTYWFALAMTVLLAACAFRLSFDALRDLAISSGIQAHIAWLWPIAVDATIAQATVALLSLSRGTPTAAEDVHAAPIDAPVDEELTPPETAETRSAAAIALIQDRTKTSPEIVADILERYARGEKVPGIAAQLDVLPGTVKRILAAHKLATVDTPNGLATARS